MHSSAYPNLKLATLVLAINTALLMSVSAQAASESSTDTDLEKQLGYEPSTTLEKIVVVAENEKADGPVQGIAASTVSSTTGADESILKSPQSVTVVGQQEMESIGADDMIGTIQYSSGINEMDGQEKDATGSIIRGFVTLNEYRDGQKYNDNAFEGSQEVYGLERIEVVKGPNSVLDGAMTPGGVVNAISKRPYFTDGYEVNAEVGSFNHKKVSTDINQLLTDDIAVRFVGLYQDSDTFINFIPDDKVYIAPSLTWQAGDDTTLTLQADYEHIKAKYAKPLPLEGTVLKSPNGKIARDTFQGVPEFDDLDRTRYTLGYEIKHNLQPNLNIKHNLRLIKNDMDLFRTGLYRQPVEEDTKMYRRYLDKRFNATDILTGSISANYDWSANSNIDNTTLIELDYLDSMFKSDTYGGTANNINIFNPDHSLDEIGKDFEPTGSWIDTTKQLGINLQNKLTYNDTFVVSTGVRHDEVELGMGDYETGKIEETMDYSATTGRFGVAYLMNNGLAPYAGYSQSFEPKPGKDRAGNLYKPVKGEQYEVGVRYQPEGSDTLLTGSIYRIDQTDVLVDDPNNAEGEYFSIQLGEVRSQGVELEAKTQIGENANLIAAYAYTDARTTKASPLYPEDEGKRTNNVPYNRFSLWGDYRFTEFGLPDLTVGAGVRYKGSTVAGRGRVVDVPSYTLVDAMAKYDWSNNLTLSLNVKNLFDKEYVNCGFGCNYGEPRNVVGKVTYKW